MERDTENDGKGERQDSGDTTQGTKACKKTIEFIVLIRGRNCAKTIEKCLRSLRRQTYPHWKAVISLDCPTDDSCSKVDGLVGLDERFTVVVNRNHFGLCKNMYAIIAQAARRLHPQDADVAVVVDADDHIAKDAFATIEEVFRKNPGVYITHGSYMKMSVHRRTKVSRPNIKKGSIRKLPWRSSHLKAIEWEVIRQAKPSWFQHKGIWLEAASDLALMFPCIELVGLSRVKHIHKVIYYWNDHMTKKKRVAQKRCEKILRGKKL